MSAERDRGGDRTPGTTEDSQTPAGTGAGPGAIRILDARDLRIHNSVSNPDDRNPVRTAWRRSSVSFVNVGRTTKIS